MYVGTEHVSIILKTNKVVSPQVPTHKEDFICISFFCLWEVYFSAIFDGLYKMMNQVGLSLLCCIKTRIP
jgi:hypothetical protein